MCKFYLTLKGNGYTFRDGNSVKILSPVSEKGSALKGKNLLPLGANSFLLDETLFQKGLGMQESKKEVTKVVFLVKKTTEYIQPL